MQDINIQKIAYLTCHTHKKRIQFICAVEKCEKSLICADCLVLDKFHINDHLDGFCSTDDYQSKIIFSNFQKFEEGQSKLKNQEDVIRNIICEISQGFDKQINSIQAKVFATLAEYFSTMKEKIKSLIERKFDNYLKSLQDLGEEIRITKNNSEEFLEKLKKILNQESMSVPDIETQIRLFNNKKYYDRALIGRIDTLVAYLNEQANASNTMHIAKSFLNLDDNKLQIVGNDSVSIIKNALKKTFESQNTLENLAAKPIFAISRIKDNFLTLDRNAEFEGTKKLEKISSFEMSEHSSTKLNSVLIIDERYLLTCANERKYKIWSINPSRLNSGLKNAIKAETPFSLIAESESEWHSNFINASDYFILNEETYRIITGDKNGFLSVSDFEFSQDKLLKKKLVSHFQANENKIVNIQNMPNSDSIAIGDNKFIITFWSTKDWKLKFTVRAPDSIKLMNFCFVNLFSYICGINNKGTLFSWKLEYSDTVSTNFVRTNILFEANSLDFRRCNNHLKLVFEKGPFSSKSFNIFATNFKGDNMVFVSDGASLKIITLYNGETITTIEGSHYQGISNLFFVLNLSTESQIYRLLNSIENEYLHKNQKEIAENKTILFSHYRELLNCFKLITVSDKDSIKFWSIRNFEPQLLDQDSHSGGSYGKFLFKYQNKKKENFLITSGKNSNKITIYQIN